MRRPPLKVMIAATLAVTAVTSACGDERSASPSLVTTTSVVTTPPVADTIVVVGDNVNVASLVDSVTALCDSRRLAIGSDLAGAKTTFFDRTHDSVHTVARALEDIDRGAAASLLEAKNKVETDFGNAGSTTADLAADLAALAELAGDGLSQVGIEAPSCAA